MADKPFTIIGVNSDQDIGRKDLKQIREVVKAKNLTWRSFQNTSPEEKISSTWNVRGWPTIYVIDTKGKIRFKNVRGAAMDKAITELMEEAGVKVEITHDDEEEDGNP